MWVASYDAGTVYSEYLTKINAAYKHTYVTGFCKTKPCHVQKTEIHSQYNSHTQALSRHGNNTTI